MSLTQVQQQKSNKKNKPSYDYVESTMEKIS